MGTSVIQLVLTVIGNMGVTHGNLNCQFLESQTFFGICVTLNAGSANIGRAMLSPIVF